jgi:phage shock protein PspC (stress-responsive transcriptional regulator)
MKKTFTININGTVFHIDDDAYEKLNDYISQINRHFSNDADASEIVEDIESRISELFLERTKGDGEVITIALVQEVIQIMGSPEAFADAKEDESDKGRVDNEYVKTKSSRTHGKKLYRDPEERVLGGVCSGLGAYFNMDPIIVRLIFIVLFFGGGSSILIYLILWIIIPKATNTAQRLEMRGEEVNINNISKTVKEESQDGKDSYQNYKTAKTYSRSRERNDDGGSIIGSIIRGILKIILVFFGIILVSIGIIAILALVISIFASNELLGISPFSHEMPQYLNLFVNSDTLSWFWFGLALTIGIPLVMLAYYGAKLIFRFKSNNPAIGASSLGLWVIGVIILFCTSIRAAGEFKHAGTSTKREIVTSKSDTLYLKLGVDEFSDSFDSDIDFNGLRIASDHGRQFLIKKPRVKIEKSDTKDFSIVIKSKARGRDIDKAQNYASSINYDVKQQDSLLTFKPWFILPDKSVWRKQEVDIVLMVPENKVIYLDNSMITVINDIKNTSHMWDGDMVGKFWIMKSEELELTQRKPAPIETPKKNKK